MNSTLPGHAVFCFIGSANVTCDQYAQKTYFFLNQVMNLDLKFIAHWYKFLC